MVRTLRAGRHSTRDRQPHQQRDGTRAEVARVPCSAGEARVRTVEHERWSACRATAERARPMGRHSPSPSEKLARIMVIPRRQACSPIFNIDKSHTDFGFDWLGKQNSSLEGSKLKSHIFLNRRQFAAFSTGTLAVGLVPSLFAQVAWPSRPVRLVLGYAPGGGSDVMARVLSQPMN